jgi:DNA-binding NtrC family response regulator
MPTGADEGGDLPAAGVRRCGRGDLGTLMGLLADDPEFEIFMMPGSGRPPAVDATAAPASLAAIIGESAPMQALKRRARQLLAAERRGGDRDLPPILISGDTGTGKKLLAEALHAEGARSAGPFVEVSCASLTPQRFEAEMFGLEAAQATPGGEGRTGLVESADGGTLFLDAVGELDLACQTRLLKLLAEQALPRGGAGRERRADIRIIAATSQDLEQMVQQGRFRGDLYFRLCVVTLAMPPLHSTGDDILRIAEFYLQHYALRYGRSGLRFAAGARARLLAYGWPGNVRELRNKLEQTALLAQDELIDAEQLGIGAVKHRPAAVAADLAGGEGLDPSQREAVRGVLEKTAWNVARSARLLGLTRDMMRYRIRKFGLVRPDD